MVLYYLATSLALAADEQQADFTIFGIWEHSGLVARCVIIMLVLMLLWTLFTAIERLIAFNRGRNQSVMVAAEIGGPLTQGNVAGALKVAKDERFKSSYLAAVLRAGLAELDQRFDRHGFEAAHRSVNKVSSEELAKLRRGFTILATTGSTAPFVGLFGTTFGVINAFQQMSGGGAGLASVSAGISEALITTAFGIFVAVIGVWLFNYFNLRIEKVTEELSSSQAEFEDWAEKQLIGRMDAREAGK